MVGACADRASTMIGKKSGVLTKLKEMFPNILLWHCMCHHIELAVGDSVRSTNQINHVQVFLDKLYTVYNQPKAQRELAECASSLDIEIKKIGRVLGVRWVASSFRALDAIWENYPALVQHAEAVSCSTSPHKLTYKGMLKVLQSPQFLHSLAVLRDSLKEVSILSEALQKENCSLPMAYARVNSLVKALKAQKEQVVGPSFKEFEEREIDDEFKGVKLVSKGVYLDRSRFLQALIDNMQSRLEGTVASGTRHESDRANLQQLMVQIDVLHPLKWPSGVDAPWVEGEARLRQLCERFNVPFTNKILTDFRDFIEAPDQTDIPESIKFLKSIVSTLPVSSSDCERGFSAMNNICTQSRNKLSVPHMSELVFISLVGPPLEEFNPEAFVQVWLKKHRSADDTRSKVAQLPIDSQRYKPIWKLLC